MEHVEIRRNTTIYLKKRLLKREWSCHPCWHKIQEVNKFCYFLYDFFFLFQLGNLLPRDAASVVVPPRTRRTLIYQLGAQIQLMEMLTMVWGQPTVENWSCLTGMGAACSHLASMNWCWSNKLEIICNCASQAQKRMQAGRV